MEEVRFQFNSDCQKARKKALDYIFDYKDETREWLEKVWSRTHQSSSEQASTEAPGLRPGAQLEEGLDQQILAISTERQKFSRINTAYAEARVTGKHRRYNRLQHHPHNRSPTSSSVSSLRLKPWELDGEALRVATKAGDREEQRRLNTGREEAETCFKPVSLRTGTDPEPAQEKP
ncbi:hypothetical protein F2Q68_00045543 [Brassica cretica]|uniref:Uncharacterized protein n=1 Tax=Brassica cretica TaxID=69181 RepID=A0A8S9LLI7_BRACR|nr:hypothetical protein F2Q68_00045543 [Brassica cretica]